MRKTLTVAVLALTFGAAQAQTAQQNLMGTCSTDAACKKGDERKAFMKTWRQQERMKSCNADATGEKGDEREKFMSECLEK